MNAHNARDKSHSLIHSGQVFVSNEHSGSTYTHTLLTFTCTELWSCWYVKMTMTSWWRRLHTRCHNIHKPQFCAGRENGLSKDEPLLFIKYKFQSCYLLVVNTSTALHHLQNKVQIPKSGTQKGPSKIGHWSFCSQSSLLPWPLTHLLFWPPRNSHDPFPLPGIRMCRSSTHHC